MQIHQDLLPARHALQVHLLVQVDLLHAHNAQLEHLRLMREVQYVRLVHLEQLRQWDQASVLFVLREQKFFPLHSAGHVISGHIVLLKELSLAQIVQLVLLRRLLDLLLAQLAKVDTFLLPLLKRV